MPLHAAAAASVPSAVGGLTVQAQTGSAQAAYLGFGSAALLGMSAVAMSDIRDSELGELGVKTAWGEWAHQLGGSPSACAARAGTVVG